MPACLEFGAQLKVIKDLTVKNDPERLILVSDGLLPTAQINDAETRIAQRRGTTEINAELVRSAVPDHAQHLADHALRNRIGIFETKNSDDATHAFEAMTERTYQAAQFENRTDAVSEGLHKSWLGMKVSGGATLALNIAEHAFHLFATETDRRPNLLGSVALVQAVQHHVHFLIGKRKIEFLLGLGHRIGIGRGRTHTDLPGDAQIFGHLVDLRFVKVGYRFHVGSAIPQLHKETLVILQPVWRAGHRVIEPVRVIVFQHLSGPLLEVGGRNQPKISLRIQSHLETFPRRRNGY